MGLKAIAFIAAVQSATYTTTPATAPALAGLQIIVVNVASASTVNLPASPALNQIIVVQDGSMNASTNNITVQGNGNNINIPTGISSSYVIGENGTDAWFNWNGTAWGLLA